MGNKLNNIGIIGNGSWGTALTKILTDNGNRVHWWVRNANSVAHLKERHNNPIYLTSVRFADNSIVPTDDIKEVLSACDTLVFAVPSAYAQQVIESVDSSIWKTKKIISAIKGILPNSHKLLNDYLCDSFQYPLENYVSITGPCHAEEIAQERLSYLTFSGLDDTLTESVAQTFKGSYLNTTYNHDIWGAQFAAVLKNIYAIGAGIAHSLDYGDNFLSVYITNCYREMYHYLNEHFEKVHPSNEHPDFHTSAYLGDLLVTCYSLHSRNRTFGAMIGKGYSVQTATLEMNMVAEGYYAARGMQHITKAHDIAIPIATCIYDILWNKEKPDEVFRKMEQMFS